MRARRWDQAAPLESDLETRGDTLRYRRCCVTWPKASNAPKASDAGRTTRGLAAYARAAARHRANRRVLCSSGGNAHARDARCRRRASTVIALCERNRQPRGAQARPSPKAVDSLVTSFDSSTRRSIPPQPGRWPDDRPAWTSFVDRIDHAGPVRSVRRPGRRTRDWPSRRRSRVPRASSPAPRYRSRSRTSPGSTSINAYRWYPRRRGPSTELTRARLSELLAAVQVALAERFPKTERSFRDVGSRRRRPGGSKVPRRGNTTRRFAFP